MGQPVVHFEILGKDGERLRKYYAEMFGWKFHDVPGMPDMDYKTVDREDNEVDDETGINGGVGTAPDGTSHTTFYVYVEDVGAALEKAEELGGKRIMGPQGGPEGTGGMTLGYFSDPEGHVVGLVNMEGQG